ncbi:NADPH-cytochrome P450 reductase [Neonectria magnoliae]|uniref:NADPH-cytochrome P450 reductase n=1 Tax=Neonectria magnoliae TaxID=2732573 RepID=A0ABR1I7E9_9HYPO
MASSFALSSSQAQLWNNVVQTISKSISPEDYLLLPLVVLGSAFVINKGSIFPKSDPYRYKFFERPQQLSSSSVQSQSRSRNIADIVSQSNADLVVFWGSQSGTAEGFAQRLARESHQRFKLKPIIADMSDYEAESVVHLAGSTLVVFIVSTYGEGEPSDNAQDFVGWMNSTVKASLQHIKFAAFGCGNSNYLYFNKTVDEVTAAMSKFGATQILPTGKGNEATRTTEEDFMDWKEKLFSTVASALGLSEQESGYKPLVDVVEQPSTPSDKLHLGRPFQKASTKPVLGAPDIVLVPVVSNKLLTRYATQDRACIEATVDLSAHAQVKYKTGDHVAVWPENPTEEVDRLLRVLEIEMKRDIPITITQKSEYDDVKVPGLTTTDALFRAYLEICSPVPRETVSALALIAPSVAVKEALEAISKDKEAYASFLERHHVTLARLLEYAVNIDPATSWSSLPLSFVIDVLPPTQPRLYSIASSRITSPRAIALAVSVKPSTLSGNPDAVIPGLTSTYLSTKKPSNEVVTATPNIYVQVRKSAFKLPVNAAIPLVMVAAGTGIAPLRAFLHERARLSSVGKQVGPVVLFFGCQNEADYLYQDELADFSSGQLAGKLEVVTAFSRAGGKKTYVQDMVRLRKQDVTRMLGDEDAAFYICGAATMAKAVGNVLTEATMETHGWSETEAIKWRATKKKENRWFEDVWS